MAIKVAEKYYCGAAGLDEAYTEVTPSCNPPQRSTTLEGAVAHARDLLRENPRRQTIYIVKIVAAVQRATVPITVQKVV